MKTKKKKYIWCCDNPTLCKPFNSKTCFNSKPIYLKNDYSRNGAYHLREENTFQLYDYPTKSLETFDIMYPDKI